MTLKMGISWQNQCFLVNSFGITIHTHAHHPLARHLCVNGHTDSMTVANNLYYNNGIYRNMRARRKHAWRRKMNKLNRFNGQVHSLMQWHRFSFTEIVNRLFILRPICIEAIVPCALDDKFYALVYRNGQNEAECGQTEFMKTISDHFACNHTHTHTSEESCIWCL